MPLEKAMINAVIEQLPSPIEGQKAKVNKLSVEFQRNRKIYQNLKRAISTCNQNYEPIVIFVTKMQPFSSRIYDMAIRSSEKSQTVNRLVAISRVYSGRVKPGSKVFVFGANHTAEHPDMTEVQIPHLFLLMGQQLNPIQEAGPGCIIGIGGLENVLLKTGTICSESVCPNFSKVEGISIGLVKVAIEP